MKIKTIYIDDEDKELKKYERKFGRDEKAKNRFEIVTINSQMKVGDIINEVERKNFELILVDFDLSKPKNNVLIGISGVPLSNALKEKFPEVPIVLFTKKSVFKIEQYPSQILPSLDEIIYKTDIFDEDVDHLNVLYELAIGFKKLRDAKSKNWIDLLKLIKAPESDYDNLKLSNPPITSRSKWSVSEAAEWIRNILLKYPGILYDPIHSATFLGMSEDAFSSDLVQKFFAKAKYSGIFAPAEGRWWKSKLHEIAYSIMNEKERDLPVCEGFPLAWERTEETQIEMSKCIFSGKSPAEWICYILKKPMMIEYSLSYKPDSRPSIMDEARVSFEAIRESNDVNDNLFDPIGQEMLAEIRKLPKGGGDDIEN